MRKQLNASRPQSRFCRIASKTAAHALMAAVLLSFAVAIVGADLDQD